MNPLGDVVASTTAVAEQGADSAPETTKATKKASPKNGAAKGKKAAKEAKPAKKAAAPKAAKTEKKPASKKAAKEAKPAKAEKKASVPREFSKKNAVLDLLRRKEGVTLAEIAKATDWQNHSIRGFLSGQVSKKMGLAVESTKNDKGERVYRLK